MIRHCNATLLIQFLKLFSANSLFVCAPTYLCLVGLFFVNLHVYIQIFYEYMYLCVYVINVLLLFYIISAPKKLAFDHSPVGE